jgi:oligopeptide/dipeptide ABC transporter ATP-binding protein
MEDRMAVELLEAGQATRTDAPLLDVRNLEVTFGNARSANAVRGVQDVSFRVFPGETLGIVGESGCGKTMSALSVIGLLPEFAKVTGGTITWQGETVDWKDTYKLRGRAIAMIPQDAMTALNPLLTVESQIAEVLRKHLGLKGVAVRNRVYQLLQLVRIDEPARVAHQYPWQLSGGMAQRVVIAMALAAEPSLVIADEPTTALDVTVQSEILALLHSLQAELQLALILITHDLGVVAHMAHRTSVMYAGRVVETGTTKSVFREPGHPYTRGLIASTPHPFILQNIVGIRGSAPLALKLDLGCSYRDRCDKADDRCEARPALTEFHSAQRKVACWHANALSSA